MCANGQIGGLQLVDLPLGGYATNGVTPSSVETFIQIVIFLLPSRKIGSGAQSPFL